MAVEVHIEAETVLEVMGEKLELSLVQIKLRRDAPTARRQDQDWDKDFRFRVQLQDRERLGLDRTETDLSQY